MPIKRLKNIVNKHAFKTLSSSNLLQKRDPLLTGVKAFDESLSYTEDDYPMSAPFIKKLNDSNQYLLKAPVQSYKAPARFVMGLKNEVDVIGSESFLKHLRRVKS